jgi:hypothetical protein
MVTETGDVVQENEDQRSTSVTMTAMKYSQQNSANIADHVHNNGLASVNVQLNGPQLTITKTAETVPIGSNEPEVQKSHVQTLTSAENTDFLNGKYRH